MSVYLLTCITNLRCTQEYSGTKVKVKSKGLDTCYSATYMSQTRDQQRFTISEVGADWHEAMVPQRIMWPSTARVNGQLTVDTCEHYNISRHTIVTISHTRPHFPSC